MGAYSPADTALLLDVMLGKLATYLRMCGYDTAYALDRGVEDDSELLDLIAAEGRLLVTRDAELARRANSLRQSADLQQAEEQANGLQQAEGLLLSSLAVTDQLRELADEEFTLELSEPQRCSACNGELVSVGADEVTPEYAPDSAESRIWRCQDCGQHFWKGSHWESVAETLSGL